MTRTPADLLARLRDGDRRDPRPHRLRLDGGLTLELPSPGRLAEVYALPLLSAGRELYRAGQAILAREAGAEAEPRPVNLLDLRAELLKALEDLPERGTAEAGRPYRDARLFVRYAEPASARKYADDVVLKVRTSLPTYRRPAASRAPSRETVPAAERVRRSRERAAAIEAESVRLWLEALLCGDVAEDYGPGDIVPSADLLALCLADLAAWADDEEETDDGDPVRIPRQRVFYAVADEVLGPRRRVGKARTLSYALPD